MILEELQPAHKSLFERLRGETPPCLSAYVFANLYAWKPLYRLRVAAQEGVFAVFMQDDAGMFMPLPPLGEGVTRETVSRCFELMTAQSRHAAVVRIENIAPEQAAQYESWGWLLREKPGDYVCSRDALAQLAGTAYKHKRADVNRFLREHDPLVRELSPEDAAACLELYGRWMRERAAAPPDALYRGMLEDNRKALETVFGEYAGLGVRGIAVELAGKLQAFTLGGEISREAFCVIFEVANLKVRGLSQFIFREFASRLEEYRYLNLMDDSGLENLSRVKRSYNPEFISRAFIATIRA
jgi:uncharacterized protein